ncbi:galactosyltransferase-related protein [Maridesulfovibrio sp. FT414]|uniref:galactosyltransferase-related protein n=1 Tax=Maridesulfovibrio sp. FT414 TaxID=2979469 RepID=UPI003D803C0B
MSSLKTDLRDVVFLIPCRIDSLERVRNLKIIVSLLTFWFETRVMVIEEGPSPVLHDFFPDRPIGLELYFIEDHSGLFHRSHCVNELIRRTRNPVIANCDVDVLCSPRNYVRARNLLTKDKFDVLRPFDGRCLNVAQDLAPRLLSERSLDFLDESNCRLLYPDTPGGLVMVRRDVYLKAGMDNENFVSYGFEDDERLVRLAGLGYRLGKLEGPLFHLDHPRGVNSHEGLNPHNEANRLELEKVKAMSRDELRAYVNSWSWTSAIS